MEQFLSNLKKELDEFSEMPIITVGRSDLEKLIHAYEHEQMKYKERVTLKDLKE